MIKRGDVWWATLLEDRRPVLIVQSDKFNRSAIGSIIVAAFTTNLGRARAPGNVAVAADESGLPKDSVLNVSQLFSLDRTLLTDHVGSLPRSTMKRVDDGLRLILEL